MELYTQDLKEAISALLKYVPGKTTMPILQHILFKRDGEQLTLSSTNLESQVVMLLDVSFDYGEEVNITLPAAEIRDLVNRISAEKIKFTFDDKACSAVMRYGKSKSTLKGMSGDDFPQTDFKFDLSFKMNLDKFKELVRYTALSASQDESHPVLTGMNFVSDGNTMSVMTADGYRASKLFVSLESEPFNIIVPTKAITALLLPNVEEVEISVSTSRFGILADNFRFTSQLISGNFPEIKRIIPPEFAITVKVDSDLLKNAMECAMVFSRDAAKLMKIMVDSENVRVISTSQESGDGENVVSLQDSDTNGFEISVNGQYLIDILRVVNGSVLLKFNQKTTPIGVFEIGNDNYTHIVMPMHA